MAIDYTNKEHIRRHLGYPGVGESQNVQIGGGGIVPQAMERSSWLETRMNIQTPTSEAIICGVAVGSIEIAAGPAPGGSLSVTLTGGGLANPVTVAITQVGDDDEYAIATKMVHALGQTQALFDAGFLFETRTAVEEPQVIVKNPAPFKISIIGSTLGAYVTATGVLLPPFVQTGTNPDAFIYGLVPMLNFFESGIAGSYDNMDLVVAGEYKAQTNEMQKREKLYNVWVTKLALHLNVDVYSRSSGGSTRVRI